MKFLLVASLAESLIVFRAPLILALQKAGVDVHVAAPDISADIDEKLRNLGVEVHDVPLRRTGMNVLDDLRTCVALWCLMRRVKPDFFLGYTIKPVVYGGIAAWIAGVPNRFSMITGLGYAFQSGRKNGFLLTLVQRLYKLALSKMKVVFFQNPDDRDLFRSLLIVSEDARAIVVNGSGVDVDSFSVSPFPDGEVRFLLIARLLGDKGVREYVEAARRVKARYPASRFRIVGWIDENPNSISVAELEGWQVDGCIEYIGRLADVRPAIADCSVYVLPSYREGTPRTVLEAMAMGRPIITTDAPGCRETVVDGENGFLVAVKSVDALEQAMLKFIETPGLIARMGVSARRIAERKYDVHRVNDFMIAEMGCVPK